LLMKTLIKSKRMNLMPLIKAHLLKPS
jgi:hypothetical protein